MKSAELGRHVGKRSQTVGVEVLVLLRGGDTNKRRHFYGSESSCGSSAGVPAYPGPGHVELDGADDHQDEQTAQGDLRQGPLRVPRDVLQHLEEVKGDSRRWNNGAVQRRACTHHLVDGAVERIVLRQDEQDDEGHVDVVGVPVLHVVQDLQDGQHLSTEQENEAKSVCVCVSHQ